MQLDFVTSHEGMNFEVKILETKCLSLITLH